VGPSPVDRGRSGSKHHLLTDGHGVPLAITITAGNTHDVRAALETIVDLNPVRGQRGRPKSRPGQLIADKAYDDHSLRDLLTWLGIKPDIPHRGDSSHGLGKKRWAIERTFAWLKQFRRLRIRWDKRADIHQAMLHLAATMICYRIHANRFCP